MLTQLVEDDEDYASIIEYTLKRGGHEVAVAYTANAAVSFCQKKRPDLAILDVMLPDASGYDLCRTLKERSPELGVIFLSSLGMSNSVVNGLQSGADDYITKPFDPGVLLARVAAIQRRTVGVAAQRNRLTEMAPRRIESHGFVIDTSESQATFQGRRLNCTPIEAEILAELLSYPGEVLSYDFLTNRIWGYSNVDDSILIKGHISSIRKKLRSAGLPESVIRTVHNTGYSYVPEQVAEVAPCGSR